MYITKIEFAFRDRTECGDVEVLFENAVVGTIKRAYLRGGWYWKRKGSSELFDSKQEAAEDLFLSRTRSRK